MAGRWRLDPGSSPRMDRAHVVRSLVGPLALLRLSERDGLPAATIARRRALYEETRASLLRHWPAVVAAVEAAGLDAQIAARMAEIERERAADA